MTKWPLLLAIAALSVAAHFLFRTVPEVRLSPTAPVAKSADQATIAVRSASMQSSSAASSGVGDSTALTKAPVTRAWRRAHESPHILGAIAEILNSGTKDEKEWAVRMLGSCTFVFNGAPPVPGDGQDPSLARMRAAASEQLRDRCSGIDKLSADDRSALRSKLLEGAADNRSVLGQLNSIEGDRWSGDQARLISDSLYNDDPVIAKEGFLALMGAFDDKAPGGRDRRDAFVSALAPDFLNSEFVAEVDALTRQLRWEAQRLEVPLPAGLRALEG